MKPGDRSAAGDVAVRVIGDEGGVAEQLRADGFALVEDGSADVLILCWPQATRDALSRVARMREQGAGAVLAVVGDVPTAHLVRALTARLDGVVRAEDVPTALLPAVLAVAAGQSSHPLAFREQLDRPLLSAREKQVLAMVVLGLTNAEIGQKLFVTEASVKAHLTSAFAKLGVRSREAATALILDPEAGYGPGILRITPDE